MEENQRSHQVGLLEKISVLDQWTQDGNCFGIQGQCHLLDEANEVKEIFSSLKGQL